MEELDFVTRLERSGQTADEAEPVRKPIVRCRPITKVLGAAPELGRSILAAGQPRSWRPPTDRGCKVVHSRRRRSLPNQAASTRAALLAMRERIAEPEVRIHSPPADRPSLSGLRLRSRFRFRYIGQRKRNAGVERLAKLLPVAC